MAYSIKLHKEYGLNPTISKCILCGKEKNQLVLLGSAYKEKAPMTMVTELEPCEDCRKKYLSKGVMLVEANRGEKGEILPTGKIAVIKKEIYDKHFNLPTPKNIAIVERDVWEKIGLDKVLKKEETK
jgi:deoxycytidylate deaminase